MFIGSDQLQQHQKCLEITSGKKLTSTGQKYYHNLKQIADELDAANAVGLKAYAIITGYFLGVNADPNVIKLTFDGISILINTNNGSVLFYTNGWVVEKIEADQGLTLDNYKGVLEAIICTYV